MAALAELDASNNRLTQVPMTLGDCAGLRALDLSNNQLGLLPLRKYRFIILFQTYRKSNQDSMLRSVFIQMLSCSNVSVIY